MTPFIEKAIAERKLGLALHYPFLHAAVVGMTARRTLEFGAGGSTRVFLDALPSGARHYSVSMEEADAIRAQHGIEFEDWEIGQRWHHRRGLSSDYPPEPGVMFDLILHDGSHAADVVARDIACAWPRLRPFGLLLVHDTQHSYCGAEVRAGVTTGLLAAHARHSLTTLPYGFGLTIIRKEEAGEGAVSPAPAKVTSEHTTALMPFKEQAT